MAPGSCCKAKDCPTEKTHIDKNMILSIPSIPDGILDMSGPRTLEGGYSASQYVSSAFKAVFCMNGDAVSADVETTLGAV
jgi:non-ribosomal peptide synthetase component E (peptide arylation enzyme)